MYKDPSKKLAAARLWRARRRKNPRFLAAMQKTEREWGRKRRRNPSYRAVSQERTEHRLNQLQTLSSRFLESNPREWTASEQLLLLLTYRSIVKQHDWVTLFSTFKLSYHSISNKHSNLHRQIFSAYFPRARFI